MLNQEQITYLAVWLTKMQRKMGSGFGEGFLLNGASVIWEETP